MSGGDWLRLWPALTAPLADFVCFPGAGAGASTFRRWRPLLPAFVNLYACQAPGREDRMDEPFAEGVAQAADAAADAVLDAASARRRLVLFGHSMGGALAFEVARRLTDAGRAPEALLISASSPPRGAALSAPLSREALRALLLDYDLANEAIVRDEDLFASLGPVVGADIALLRAHRLEPESPRLSCPAELLSGAGDPAAPPSRVAEWRRYFAGRVAEATLDGGHHFIFQDSEAEVIRRVTAHLTPATARA